MREEDDLEGRKNLEGASAAYTLTEIEHIASQFQVEGPLSVRVFPGKGNINLHTYEVSAGGNEYLLQLVNSNVFTMPHRVMNAMIASIDSQREALEASGNHKLWQPIELVPTKDGQPYLDRKNGHGPSVWRLMVRIPASVCYKSLSESPKRKDQLAIAEQTGRGLAIYSDLTAAIDASRVEGSLPGYRDTSLYYRQFHSVLSGCRTLEDAKDYLPDDVLVRVATEKHFKVALDDDEFNRRMSDPEVAPFIKFAKDKEAFGMGLWKALDGDKIRRTVIHGDTKIENFLFCDQSGHVKALVDLDTIMPFTWLADWGDLLRSLVNVAGEKERDLSKVVVDWDVYAAVAKGFLETSNEITEEEVDLMDFAVQAIALELGLRFLTDYLRGDTYFALDDGDPADLNKVRGMVQLTLCQRLMNESGKGKEILARARRVPNNFLS